MTDTRLQKLTSRWVRFIRNVIIYDCLRIQILYRYPLNIRIHAIGDYGATSVLPIHLGELRTGRTAKCPQGLTCSDPVGSKLPASNQIFRAYNEQGKFTGEVWDGISVQGRTGTESLHQLWPLGRCVCVHPAHVINVPWWWDVPQPFLWPTAGKVYTLLLCPTIDDSGLNQNNERSLKWRTCGNCYLYLL